MEAADSMVGNGYAEYANVETRLVELESEDGRILKKPKIFITLSRADTFQEKMKLHYQI